MEECIKDGSGCLPGKTIFFCSSKAQPAASKKSSTSSIHSTTAS